MGVCLIGQSGHLTLPDWSKFLRPIFCVAVRRHLVIPESESWWEKMIPLRRGGDFVVNVSADDVMERDIDLEIEARQRGAMQPASYWRKPADTSRSSSLQRTFSQRMLSTVNKSKHARGYSAPKDLGVTADNRVDSHILERCESRT